MKLLRFHTPILQGMRRKNPWKEWTSPDEFAAQIYRITHQTKREKHCFISRIFFCTMFKNSDPPQGYIWSLVCYRLFTSRVSACWSHLLTRSPGQSSRALAWFLLQSAARGKLSELCFSPVLSNALSMQAGSFCGEVCALRFYTP